MASDLQLSVTVTRDALGLQPLEVANSEDYYCSPQFLGAAVQWNRQQVQSQWLDGAVTTSRRRNMVTEQIGIEVVGDTLDGLQAKMNTLISAFIQDSYQLAVATPGTLRIYQCEAADYQDASWTTPRQVACQGQIVFSVPRQPVALAGGF